MSAFGRTGHTVLAGVLASLLLAGFAPVSRSAPANISRALSPGPLPVRVHVFEDFETEIEKRWWLRGTAETNNLPDAKGTRAMRGAPSKNFDRKMGDQAKTWNAVVFNPVPGPPMAGNTHLTFRYWIKGTDQLRVQIYSLSRNYHRFLTLTNLPQGTWQQAAVNMTHARRPDGSGGPLAADERIDDIQFYVSPEAELLVDDIVLYERPREPVADPFPARLLFTGWFDTGKQGEEWPGEFEIVAHEPPLTWDAARSVKDPATGRQRLRVGMRGQRPLAPVNRLRFRYRAATPTDIDITLRNAANGQAWRQTVEQAAAGQWGEVSVDFLVSEPGHTANEIEFTSRAGSVLLVDDLLLFQPGDRPVTASLHTDRLWVVAADNRAYGPDHRAGYNGISELAIRGAPGKNLFVPFYAGLNFEHIFSGDTTSYGWDKFEPRRAPMLLEAITPSAVVMRQERTEHWPLRSEMTFRATGDAIDFRFCGTPLADAWQKHGYIGLFFASYIHQPEDMSIEFIGRSRPGRGDTTPRWIKHLPPEHGVAASHRPAGSGWDPAFDEGFEITLASGFSDYEYLHPFYYGRSGGRTFVMMFRRPGKGGEVRFAQSPSGGGRGNPAWDYIFYQRGYDIGREFCFEGRAVLTGLKRRQDIVKLYEAWSGETVVAP